MDVSPGKTITLLLGGARSGKSSYAQELASQRTRVAYLATAEALDDEMRQRIALHRASRPATWTTIEVPCALEHVVLECGERFEMLVVDCLTLWASNLLSAEDGNCARILARADALCESLRQASASVVLVSNEVGSGIVPATDSGRLYRDLLGEINRRVAAAADRVLLLVAGYPLTVKPSPEARS